MAKKKRKRRKWMAKARRRMEQKGTVGAFTRQAKSAGKSVQEYATQVLKPGSKASTTTKKRAAFAKAARKIAQKRKAK